MQENTFEYPSGFRNLNSMQDTYWEGPYTSVADANAKIPLEIRKEGVLITIQEVGQDAVKYWYKGGVADINLVIFKDAPLTVINDLVTGGVDVSLSAEQGIVLDTKIGDTQADLDNTKAVAFGGWADYTDTLYTTGSPFAVTTAAGQIALPNNAGTINDAYKPGWIAEFYDGTVVPGRLGESMMVNIEFKVRPTTAAADARINVAIDIGAPVGIIYPRDFFLPKGNGIEHTYLSSFLIYSLDTWVTNGGTIKVQAFNSNVEIYDIRYVFASISKPVGPVVVGGSDLTLDTDWL